MGGKYHISRPIRSRLTMPMTHREKRVSARLFCLRKTTITSETTKKFPMKRSLGIFSSCRKVIAQIFWSRYHTSFEKSSSAKPRTIFCKREKPCLSPCSFSACLRAGFLYLSIPPLFTSRPSPPKRLKFNKALCMELDFLHPLDDLKSASPTILKILAQLYNSPVGFFHLTEIRIFLSDGIKSFIQTICRVVKIIISF